MRQMKRIAIAFGAAAAAFALGGPAVGQGAVSALRGHDTGAPVDVAADRLEVQERADRAIWSGNVMVRQGNLSLNTARLTIAYSNSGGIEIERLDASGGVVVQSPSETARGRFAIYDLRNRLITMLGNVTLTRGESNVTGERLVLDLETGRAVMDGGAGARATAPGTIAGPDGRVTGRFTVPRRNN